MDAASLQITFVPLFKKIHEDSTCYLEVVPEVCNIPADQIADWIKGNGSYEYNIPLVYKVRLNQEKTDSILEIYENARKDVKAYHSCVDFVECPLISSAELASGDVVRRFSDNLMLTSKPLSNFELNTSSNQISSENSNFTDQEIQTIKYTTETTISSQQTDVEVVETEARNIDYKLLRDIESILEANKQSMIVAKVDKNVNSDISYNLKAGNQTVENSDDNSTNKSDPGIESTEISNEKIITDDTGNESSDVSDANIINKDQSNLSTDNYNENITKKDPENYPNDNSDGSLIKNDPGNEVITLILKNSSESKKLCISPMCSIDTSDVEVKDAKISTSSTIMYTQKAVHGSCIETYNYIPKNNLKKSPSLRDIKTDSIKTVQTNMTKDYSIKNHDFFNMFFNYGPNQRHIPPKHSRVNQLMSSIEKEIMPVKIGLEDLLTKCCSLGLKSSNGWIICNPKTLNTYSTRDYHKETRKSVVCGCVEKKFTPNRVVYSYVFDG